MGYVAHFAVALMSGSRRVGAFSAEEAAIEVAKCLNDAGFDWGKEGGIQSPDTQQRGEGISDNTVTKWRRAVQKGEGAVDPETLKMGFSSPMMVNGAVMEAAMCERAAEPFVEEEEEQGHLDTLLG